MSFANSCRICRWPERKPSLYQKSKEVIDLKGNANAVINLIQNVMVAALIMFLVFTHEIKVMFCMKILGVVSDEVLKVFHSCFAVADQRLEFVLKFRNLEVLSSGSD